MLLRMPQCGVSAILVEEAGVSAPFCDPAFFEHHDLVRVQYRGEAMGDHECGAVPGDFAQVLDDVGPRVDIQSLDPRDPARPNVRAHLAFAQGPHFCLGAALARIELRAMLDDMLSPPELTEDSGDEIHDCTESAAFAATHEEPAERVDDDAVRKLARESWDQYRGGFPRFERQKT